jgi:hypothetical protein
MITHAQLENALSWETYRELLEQLLKQGKTTGLNQSDEYIGYAKINLQRMQRLEKTVELTEELKATLKFVTRPFIWLVITEGWCGDTAQITPLLHAVEKECLNIDLKLLLRDDNPEVMDQYLTNGARSIPKLICFENATLKEVFTWGPRPAPLQEIVMDLKKQNATKEQKGEIVQKWYNNDKTHTIQKELQHLIVSHMT